MASSLALGILGLSTLSPALAISEPWQCDVRAWTRAPDLYPGTTLPGEARLALNGSDCGDVLSWAVGLRLRERAIIKKRAKTTVPLPAKPTSPSRCANSSCIRLPSNDWNDIYNPVDRVFWSDEWKDQEYLKAVQDYGGLRDYTPASHGSSGTIFPLKGLRSCALPEASIRNESLWDVNGVERVVFDIQQSLPYKPSGKEQYDHVEPFNIHVPMTNFPPVAVYEDNWRHQGSDQQMFATETQFEYYHNLTLSDGTVRIIPAGMSGFLPVTPAAVSHNGGLPWPRSTSLKTPHNYTAKVDDPNDGLVRHRPQPPACDKGNAATFDVLVEPNSLPVQGRNITLTVTITRHGNGSEYPRYADFYPSIEHGMHWARNFFSSDEEYEAFLGENHMFHFSRGSTMLMIKPAKVLEEDRAEREEHAANGRMHMTMSRSFGDRWPIGRDGARYDFEETGDGEQEQHRFELELPIAYNAMPSFGRTFDDLRSVLDITLHTTFKCQDTEEDALAGSEASTHSKSDGQARDEDWTEYELPTRTPAPKRSYHRDFSHTGRIPLDVALTDPQSGSIKPYTDPTALGPTLSQGSGAAPFRPLGHGLRDENPEERLISRYGFNDATRQRGRCKPDVYFDGCWELNGGGGGMHAAKLWQRVEMERQGKGGSPKGFVIQG